MDAVQKGLGRALLWAKRGRWTDKAILHNACLEDLRYDRQVEEGRGPWLCQILEATGTTGEFRDSVFAALGAIENGRAAEQLCQLAVFYARCGDHPFRLRLQEFVTRKPDPYDPSLGEKELIELDGEAGVLFIARFRGAALLSREFDWDDEAFIQEAIGCLGEAATMAILQRESQTSIGVQRLYDGWKKSIKDRAGFSKEAHADRMRKLGLSGVIQMAESKTAQAGLLRGWGMYADEADLRAVRDRLLDSQKPEAIANYLRVFSNRPMPEFSECFLSLLNHEHENVRNRAFVAVAQNKHPAIRRFALDNLEKRIQEFNFLQLFIRNFAKGDEELLLKHLQIPEDVHRAHWFLMDLIRILERNADADCSELAKRAYRWTPCGSCRSKSAKLLIERKVAPAWLIEECQDDAVSETRQLAKSSSN
jgi:hypothetical protein